jgi:hypothetical protein
MEIENQEFWQAPLLESLFMHQANRPDSETGRQVYFCQVDDGHRVIVEYHVGSLEDNHSVEPFPYLYRFFLWPSDGHITPWFYRGQRELRSPLQDISFRNTVAVR